MIVSLDKLIRKETDKIDLSFREEIDNISYCDNIYVLASPVNIEGKISNTNKGLYLKVDVDFTILDECSRCLNQVEVPLEYSIEGFIVKEEDYDEDEFEDFDAFIINAPELDLRDIIGQTVEFNSPSSVICDEECQGLCQGCGANLNLEECSCDENTNDEDLIDPRFAKLKDMFKND